MDTIPKVRLDSYFYGNVTAFNANTDLRMRKNSRLPVIQVFRNILRHCSKFPFYLALQSSLASTPAPLVFLLAGDHYMKVDVKGTV